MFPITLEEMETAYAEMGLEPKAGEWGDAVSCACPMLAVTAKRHGVEKLRGIVESWREEDDEFKIVGQLLGIDHRLIHSFAMGFDGYGPYGCGPEAVEAHAVGIKARERFLPTKQAQ